MVLFTVDKETCNQDGICKAVCPVGIIDLDRDAYPTAVAGAEELCIVCGHCVAACPTGSLSHRKMPVQDCPPVQANLRLSAEQCEQFLRSRRSIRVYKNKSVPREEIAKLIELARYAPTGHNSQCVEWLVLDNRDELQRLAGIVVDWMRWMLGNMPQIAQALHMDRTVRRWEEGVDVILRNAPAVVITHAEKDHRAAPAACTIALSYLELAASSLGLGSCWAGYFNAAATTFPPMQEALALPAGHRCFGAMMVGYPKFGYHRLPSRNAPAITWR